jgi:hypothetical protein
MLKGKIETVMEYNRSEAKGTLLTIWVPCYNPQFKKTGKGKEEQPESEAEYKNRRAEWESLHLGDVEINQPKAKR